MMAYWTGFPVRKKFATKKSRFRSKRKPKSTKHIEKK